MLRRDRIDSSVAPVPCPECQAGEMHRVYLTYYTRLGKQMIIIPDFPAWVCDVCGRREYDPHALLRLSYVLSPSAGNETLPPPGAQPQPPQPTRSPRPRRPQ